MTFFSYDRVRANRRRAGAGFVMGAVLLTTAATCTARDTDLTDMSIEDLMGIQVTSVSKKAQSLSDSAAAIFVITAEDIAQSGATCIPELLRMVPGLNVARIDSNKWAISSRGFNTRFSDKLLVLMDGRSLYNPLYSGVYWEVQDTVLEDVERIEVIRGPGATVWGANAVNGVINIITKHAGDTLGGLAFAGAGTEERALVGGRYGATLSEGIYGRFYGKGNSRDSYQFVTGEDSEDSWQTYRSGFRVDGSLAHSNSFNVQGDIYKGDVNQTVKLATLTEPYALIDEDEVDTRGGNVLASWTQYLSGRGQIDLQFYYDRASREELTNHEESDTLNLEFKHHFALGKKQDLIWGLNYRYIDEQFYNSFWTVLEPENSQSNLFSFFVQDEYTAIKDKLILTVGSKIEHNDSTGYEIQPSVRALFSPQKNHKIWGAVSRAVRTPTRIERNATITTIVLPPEYDVNPLPVPAAGGVTAYQDYDSQVVVAYEIGYRYLASEALSFDMALFHNDYDKLRSFEITPVFNGSYGEVYNQFGNEADGTSHGFELAVAWQALDVLKFDLAYSFINENFKDLSVTWGSEAPVNQFSLRADWKVNDSLSLNVWGRYVDNAACMYVGNPGGPYYTIDDYFTADLQLTYHPTSNLSISLVGQNLLEESHEEYVQEFWSLPTEVERGVYLKATYRF